MIGAALRTTCAANQATTARPASRSSEPEILESSGSEARGAELVAGRIRSRPVDGATGTWSNTRGRIAAGVGAVTGVRRGVETFGAPTRVAAGTRPVAVAVGVPAVGMRFAASEILGVRTRGRGDGSVGAGPAAGFGDAAARGSGAAAAGLAAATGAGSSAGPAALGSAWTGTASGWTGAAGAGAATAGSGSATGAGSAAGAGTAARTGSSPAGSR